MPYCPECGNKISITDKRCSKCGYKIMPIDIDKIKEDMPNPKNSRYHNIEFALAVVSIVLWVFATSLSLNNYSLMDPSLLYIIFVILSIGIIGALITRYYAKPGAIIVLIVGLTLIIFGINDILLPMIFTVITLIVAFFLN